MRASWALISFVKWSAIILGLANLCFGQTTSINLATQARNPDFSAFAFTRPVSVGNNLPGNCQIGQLFFSASASAGLNLFGCTSNNVWTQLGVNTAGGAIAKAIISGPLAAIPTGCNSGNLYFATDQAAGQQMYTCSANNTWTQLNSLGGSGALAMVNGAVDIVTAVVPRLSAANTFTGLNTFTLLQIAGSSTNPVCTSTSDIGKIWINTSSASNSAFEVCLAVSGTIQWVTK